MIFFNNKLTADLVQCKILVLCRNLKKKLILINESNIFDRRIGKNSYGNEMIAEINFDQFSEAAVRNS